MMIKFEIYNFSYDRKNINTLNLFIVIIFDNWIVVTAFFDHFLLSYVNY